MHNSQSLVFFIFNFLKKKTRKWCDFFQYDCVLLSHLQTTVRSVCSVLSCKGRVGYLITRNTAVLLPA